MADSLINPTNYTFQFDSSGDVIVVDNYTFAWSTAPAVNLADFDLFNCGTPSANFALQSCDYVSPIFPLAYAHGGDNTDLILAAFHIFQANPNHGQLLECVLTDNPVDEFDSIAFSGATANLDLETTTIFRDCDAFGGATADGDLTIYPPADLAADGYHGGSGESDLSIQGHLESDNYSGATAEADLETYPSALMDSNNYSGATAEVDLEVSVGVDGYHGATGEADLDISISEGLGGIDGYHGGSGKADLSPTYNLPAYVYSGDIAIADMAVTTSMSGRIYGGEYSNSILTQVLGFEFLFDLYDGGVGTIDGISTTVILFARGHNGGVAVADVTISPSTDLILNFYSGSHSNITTLDELDWNTLSFHGSVVHGDLALQLNLPAGAYSGTYAEIPFINYTANLPAHVYSGAAGILSDLVVPLGTGLHARAYSGAYAESDSGIKTHAIFVPHPIIAGLAMYDADHNHNHCDLLRFVDLRYNDNVIRWDWTDFTESSDYLKIEFVNAQLKTNWNPCDSVVTVCSVELFTRQRFEVDMYAGESTELYIPQKFTAFGDVPDSVLYDENTNFVNIRRMYFEVDMYAGESVSGNLNENIEEQYVYSGAYVSAELTPTPFGDFPTGSTVEVNLSVSVPSWRTNTFQDAPHSTLNFVNFEPIFWTKFCHGYIRPSGAAVIFDFNSIDNTGCEGKYFMQDGSVAEFQLSVEQNFFPDTIECGSFLRMELPFESIWLLYAVAGQNAIINNPELSADAYAGTNLIGKFFDEAIFGEMGSTMEVDALTVTGAAVAWITEADICLPNEYVPMTDGGDLDYDALDPDGDGILDLPDVAVENFSFRFPLYAQCISFVEE